MGRRVLIASAAIAVLAALTAIPAGARTHNVFVMSTKAGKSHVLKRHHRLPKSARVAVNPAVDTVVTPNGFDAECTAPNAPNNPGGNGQNFISNDSIEFITPQGSLIGECVANLKRTFVKGTSTKVKYNHTAVVYADIASCLLPAPGNFNNKVTGTGISVTFPNGLFVETCNAPNS